MTEAQNRALIKQRQRAMAVVRGRQRWAGAWLPLLLMLAVVGLFVALKLH